MEIIVGIGMLALSLLGGIWIAYQLLSRTVDQRFTDQAKRLTEVDTNTDKRIQLINDRLNRELKSRTEKDSEHREARGELGRRIATLEEDFRRWRDSE